VACGEHELIPELRNDLGVLTPKLEKLIHTLEWVRIEDFVQASGCGIGRPANWPSGCMRRSSENTLGMF
jgi:hypothetical protein